MNYDEWLQDFSKNKKRVATFQDSNEYAIHTITRYLDEEGCLWETAFTYTGRLVVRSGQIESNGVDIKWSEWMTLHEVELKWSATNPSEISC